MLNKRARLLNPWPESRTNDRIQRSEMARQSGRPAQLGADDVIRFLDTEHFLRELAGNLGRGRAFVRTRRDFELQEALTVQIEAPGVGWKVMAEAVVVFARDGF